MRRRLFRCAAGISIALLEPRRLMAAVTFNIDANADVHAISRYIYGVNTPLTGNYASATFTRLGGNRWTAYNWENNASNAGSDWQHQNDNFLGGGNVPGGAVAPTIEQARDRGAATMLTIPMAGYVAADKNGGGDVNQTPNYLSVRFNQAQPRKSAPLSLTPDLTDDFAYADEFVNWVKLTYPTATSDPNKPIWFSLDNEPDLWSGTHARIHPNPVTYAELITKTIDYAKAIKDVMPGTKVFGPASYGFNGYTTLQNAPDRAGRDFLETYLTELKSASDVAGKRLVDALDLHWYPEAQGDNVRITENNNSAAVVAARLQAPRSLWDPTYKETSWIANDYLNGPINLLNRVQSKINAKNPGTALAFTEYNYGGTNHISGGIAQADVLGIFGRDGVFAANQWKLHDDESFVAGALRMYRDYDGAGATFGDTSIRAATSDVAGSSVYASVSSTDANVMTIVAINKTAEASAATINLSGRTAAGAGQAYVLAGANASPQNAGAVAIGAGASTFTYNMPAYSVTTIRVPLMAVGGVKPNVIGSSFRFEVSPSAVDFTFDRDVSASLATSDLMIAGVVPTSVTWNASTNTASFVLPASLANGAYHAVLSGSGVSAGGIALGPDVPLDFFVLRGDVNRDRIVNFGDLLTLAQNYGLSGRTYAQGNVDASSDGLVNFNDLLVLAQGYGVNVPAAANVETTTATTAKRKSIANDVVS